jgi:hypothetical protein
VVRKIRSEKAGHKLPPRDSLESRADRALVAFEKSLTPEQKKAIRISDATGRESARQHAAFVQATVDVDTSERATMVLSAADEVRASARDDSRAYDRRRAHKRPTHLPAGLAEAEYEGREDDKGKRQRRVLVDRKNPPVVVVSFDLVARAYELANAIGVLASSLERTLQPPKDNRSPSVDTKEVHDDGKTEVHDDGKTGLEVHELQGLVDACEQVLRGAWIERLIQRMTKAKIASIAVDRNQSWRKQTRDYHQALASPARVIEDLQRWVGEHSPFAAIPSWLDEAMVMWLLEHFNPAGNARGAGGRSGKYAEPGMRRLLADPKALNKELLRRKQHALAKQVAGKKR